MNKLKQKRAKNKDKAKKLFSKVKVNHNFNYFFKKNFF